MIQAQHMRVASYRAVCRPAVLLLLTIVACAGREKSATNTADPADIIFRHAAVYTVDAARSWASAVAIRNGRIAYVGSDSIPAGLIGPKTEVADLSGKMLLPGF